MALKARIRRQRFPANSQLKCCATCSEWSLEVNGDRQTGKVICYTHQWKLRGNFAAQGCMSWREETKESFAKALIQELKEQGAI